MEVFEGCSRDTLKKAEDAGLLMLLLVYLHLVW